MDLPDDLICLSYCSTAAFDTRPRHGGVSPEVSRILVQSRRNNSRRGVGGVLHFGNGYFFQYLEGPTDIVDCLYAAICRDPRHYEVRRLTRRPIRQRRFERWSMKFVAIERIVDQVMQRHGLREFDPYGFTPALIDDLVVSFIQVEECAPDAEAIARRADTGRRGWFERVRARWIPGGPRGMR